MSTKFKISEKAITNALYIGAAILIVAVICVSIIAMVNQNRKNKGEVPVYTTGDESIVTKAPATNAPPASTTAQKEPETPPVTKDSISTGVDVPTQLSYKGPIETGYITKTHATDTLVYSITMNDYRIHRGIDIAASVGTPVYASADGKVSKVWRDSLMGMCISIEHANGVVTYYKNLSETLPDGLSEGCEVKAGQLIASVGETAIVEVSDASHLHFEVTKDNKQIDPLEYVTYSSAPAENTESE